MAKLYFAMADAERLGSGLLRLSRLMADASGLTAVVQTARRGVSMSLVQAEHDAAVMCEQCRIHIADLSALLSSLQIRMEKDGMYAGRVCDAVNSIRDMLQSCTQSLDDSENLELASCVLRHVSPPFVLDISCMYR